MISDDETEEGESLRVPDELSFADSANMGFNDTTDSFINSNRFLVTISNSQCSSNLNFKPNTNINSITSSRKGSPNEELINHQSIPSATPISNNNKVSADYSESDDIRSNDYVAYCNYKGEGEKSDGKSEVKPLNSSWSLGTSFTRAGVFDFFSFSWLTPTLDLDFNITSSNNNISTKTTRRERFIMARRVWFLFAKFFRFLKERLWRGIILPLVMDWILYRFRTSTSASSSPGRLRGLRNFDSEDDSCPDSVINADVYDYSLRLRTAVPVLEAEESEQKESTYFFF